MVYNPASSSARRCLHHECFQRFCFFMSDRFLFLSSEECVHHRPAGCKQTHSLCSMSTQLLFGLTFVQKQEYPCGEEPEVSWVFPKSFLNQTEFTTRIPELRFLDSSDVPVMESNTADTFFLLRKKIIQVKSSFFRGNLSFLHLN